MLSEPREERQTHRHRLPATGGVCPSLPLCFRLALVKDYPSEYEIGQRVRALVELRANGHLVKEGALGTVVGVVRHKVVVDYEDGAPGTVVTVAVQPWEVYRVTRS